MNIGARERRWAIIVEGGSHNWLGRHTDPTGEELSRVANTLAEAGMPGWLAVTEGVYYSKEPLSVMMVRQIWGQGNWDKALASFLERRRANLSGG